MNILSINIRGVRGIGKADWIKEVKNKEKASGRSGGLLCLWDPKVFKKSDCIKDGSYLLIKGKIKGCDENVFIVNVYAPQSNRAKRELWEKLADLRKGDDGLWFLIGDFNAVREAGEQKGFVFKSHCARAFNMFINTTDLHEFEMKGSKFTFMMEGERGKKLSKIDRLLVGREVVDSWPGACFRALPRRFSDHNPILLSLVDRNFGPRPFHFFNSWMDKEGFKETIKEAFKTFQGVGQPDVVLMLKFRWLREKLKKWRDDFKKKDEEEAELCRLELEELDLKMEEEELSEDEKWTRVEGEISRGCGSTFITLIPKTKDPGCLDDYRPITLVGCINKVVSKVLANRLKRVFGNLISDTQTEFLSDRLILDGPLIVNEAVPWAKKDKKKMFILKVDFNKACDNVNWGFLISNMQNLGFPKRWCNWVHGILSSARASVLVNGSPTFEFHCKKGMRQGDPISPFLFLLVMEVISVMPKRACEARRIRGIQLPNQGPILSHLLYADDCMFMGEWEEENLKQVTHLLKVFHIVSGLKINLNKSFLFAVGVENSEVSRLAGRFKCREGSFPFDHLGIRIGGNMNRIASWDFLFDIFEARLAVWKSRCISMAGRVILIKAVMESLPTYYFSLFKVPEKVINGLESIIRRFLWNGSGDTKKIHWVSWEKVTTPINLGGLGLSKLKDSNIALLSKWMWRYKNEQGVLWRKVIDSIHNTKRCWEFLPSNSGVLGVWKSIVKCIGNVKANGDSLIGCFKGVCGSGDQVRFWLDKWVGDQPLRVSFPLLFKLEKEKKCYVKDRVGTTANVFGSECLWTRSPSTS
uniref:uncharacterized protein LOC122581544 n=1 Tax=Erigeron canadensis TaxID=72917 RepID=UPI001CB908DF|nr:uncharacterized protein LOC122581544 [Erigeron canadensis]